MKRILICAAMATLLSGCAAMQKVGADVGNAWNVMTGAEVPASAVVVSANTVDAIEKSAANYLRLPICSSSGSAVCRISAATKPIEKAVAAVATARNNLEAFQRSNPGQLGTSGLYNALQSAIATLQGVLADYGVEG